VEDGRAVTPPASGMRLPWWSAPGWLQHAIEQRLDDRVTGAQTQPGGFSPGVAARLELASGRRVFVKATGPELNPASARLHRTEARIAAALPATVPAPRLLASVDRDGWVALLYEDVAGRMPAQPWNPAELARVLDALTTLAEVLTPAPIDVPTVGERFGEDFRGWRKLAEDAPADLDPWARARLSALAALESDWETAAAGESLIHADLRADNLLLTEDRVFLVDWPWACRAAPWFDLLAMLPSVRMQGGPPPEEIFDRHPVAAEAGAGAVNAALAALAGYLIWSSHEPPPPGLPTLRAFQAAQGRPALAWLRTRLT
jgi:aminoglycoside phosphotransferase (APT) family kinase protein